MVRGGHFVKIFASHLWLEVVQLLKAVFSSCVSKMVKSLLLLLIEALFCCGVHESIRKSVRNVKVWFLIVEY